MIISVITPSYNQGQFIEETIKSILFQKGKFYIDYLIQDGGSSDNSVEIIKKYENLLKKNCYLKKIKGINFYIKKNKNFKFNNCLGISYRWESKKDNGQVDALKKGFSKAIGDIYCWLNSDDFYLNNKVFERVTNYFSKDKKLEIITGDGIQVDKQGNKIGDIVVSNINYKENLFLDYHILQPSTFIVKKIYKTKYLQTKYVVAFDVFFYLSLLNNKANFLKVNEKFSAYRFYPEIKTLSLNKKRFIEQTLISTIFSKNIFFIFVGFIYHYFEIVLVRKYKNKFFYFFFIVLKKICYLIITGKTDRI